MEIRRESHELWHIIHIDQILQKGHLGKLFVEIILFTFATNNEALLIIQLSEIRCVFDFTTYEIKFISALIQGEVDTRNIFN